MNDKWTTKGVLPGRIHRSYTKEKIPGKILYSDVESKNVERKCRDILKWIDQTYLPGEKLLDVGSGPGHLEYWNTKTKKNPYDITLFDQSEYFLDIAKKSSKNIKAVKGDLPKLSFPNGHFDGVICIDILEHVDPQTAYDTVCEAFRVLKPGGWICVSIPNRHTWTRVYYNVIRHVWLPSRNEVLALMETVGFDKASISMKTRGFPGSNSFHELTRIIIGEPRDLYMPFGGSVILAKAQKPSV